MSLGETMRRIGGLAGPFPNGIGPAALAPELMAGVIVAALSIAYAIGFAAVLFPGDLRDGFATGLWSLLVSMVITTIYVNFTTTLPPLAGGPDTPVVAVASLLATAVSAKIFAAGGTAPQAVMHVLMAFSVMTLFSGAAIFLIGALRWGQALRFVPYPVIAGFLAATGCLLMVASYKVLTGSAFSFADVADLLSSGRAIQLVAAAGFALALLVARNYIKASYFLPAAFFGAAALVDVALWMSGRDTQDWFLAGVANLTPWYPFAAAASGDVDWTVLFGVIPEMATCIIVGLISLLVKISSLETTRSMAADFDQELRGNGAASLIAAPLGAMAGSVLVGPSKVFADARARSRLSGIVAGGVIILVVFANVNIPSLVPKPILAGLVLVLGYSILADAIKSAFNQKSWLEVGLAVVIALICLRFGYIVGVVAGFVSACLIFALSYGRIDVVRRQLTRATFSGGVERASEVERLLRQQGDSIQVYWLSGYIFFGSSENLFERLRRSLDAGAAQPVRYVVLDFALVTGIDSSAIASLVKLKNYCNKRTVTIVYCGLSPQLDAAFRRFDLFGDGKRHVAFATRNDALSFTEEQLLGAAAATAAPPASERFAEWLARELGSEAGSELVGSYFERKDLREGEVLYDIGSPADSIDFVASGSLALVLDDAAGQRRRIRRSLRQTVLGEMGFFRGAPRTFTIVAESPTTVYTLTRARWERLRAEQPQVHEAFLRFIIRALSDRLELAHKEIAALS